MRVETAVRQEYTTKDQVLKTGNALPRTFQIKIRHETYLYFSRINDCAKRLWTNLS